AFRPRFPKWTAPLADTGKANTAPGPHEPAPDAIRGSHTVLLNHGVGEPVIDGSPMRSGRSVLFTPVNVLIPVTMFTGLPVCACVMTASCHPSTARLPLNGSS